VSLLRRLVGRPARGRSLPGWDSLDLPWRDAELAVVDLELTGLDLRRDEIVSYGGVVVRAGRVVASSVVYGLVRPRRPVSAASIAVHALRPADLADAPGVEACVDALAELLTGRVLVAHAAWVERAFLGRAFAASGITLDGPVVDTAALARELGLAPRGSSAEPILEDLARGLGLPVHTTHHAAGDALTTAVLLLGLVARLEGSQPQTVRSLAAVSQRRSLRAPPGPYSF
jgi:DNA polymerase-3 subunit epsilon